jgi:hypothetical protein
MQHAKSLCRCNNPEGITMQQSTSQSHETAQMFCHAINQRSVSCNSPGVIVMQQPRFHCPATV